MERFSSEKGELISLREIIFLFLQKIGPNKDFSIKMLSSRNTAISVQPFKV